MQQAVHFQKCNYDGNWYRIAQSNNALAFPGIGLGAITVKAKHISDDMLWAATQALSLCSPVNQDKMAPLLPKLSETKMVSLNVALAVAEQACKEGLAQQPGLSSDPQQLKKPFNKIYGNHDITLTIK